MPNYFLNSEKEFHLGNPYVILNLLNQIKCVFKNEESFSRSLSKKLANSRESLNFNNSNNNTNNYLSNSTNSIKYNELKNKEKTDSFNKYNINNIKVCKVNGTDHSSTPYYPLNKDDRDNYLMNKENFFN